MCVSPQSDTSEDVFEFTMDQILAVVDFIVLEASQPHDASHGQSAASESAPSESAPGTSSQSETAAVDQDEDTVDDTVNYTVNEDSPEKEGISSRLDLLLSCICDCDNRIRAVVSHVQNKEGRVSRYVMVTTQSYLLSHTFRI